MPLWHLFNFGVISSSSNFFLNIFYAIIMLLSCKLEIRTGYENAGTNAYGNVPLQQKGKTFSLSVLTGENFTADISQKSSAFKLNR